MKNYSHRIFDQNLSVILMKLLSIWPFCSINVSEVSIYYSRLLREKQIFHHLTIEVNPKGFNLSPKPLASVRHPNRCIHHQIVLAHKI